MADSTFECGICADEKDLAQQVWVYPENHDEGSICRMCVLNEFDAAYNNVTDDPNLGWGIPWGRDYLQARTYISVLGDEFVENYERRQAEYIVPQADRVFCPHNASDGEKTCGSFVGAAKNTRNNKACCPKCGRWVCLICRDVDPRGDPPHECSGPPAAEEPDFLIPAEWVRGVDYQHCPECGGLHSRLDGCNFDRCSVMTCRTGFCYICGERAEHKPPYAHWQRVQPDGSDGCPLWNKTGFFDPLVAGQEPVISYVQVEVRFIKHFLRIVMDQEYSTPIEPPEWIDEISDEWILVYEFEDANPTENVSRFTKTLNTEMTYEDLIIIMTLDDCLHYHSRLSATFRLIQEQAPDALRLVAQPAGPWPVYIQDIYDRCSAADADRYNPSTMDVQYLLFLLERGSRVVMSSRFRHVPRATKIIYRYDNESRRVIFVALDTDYAHNMLPAVDASLEALERMLLDRGPNNALSLVVNLYDHPDFPLTPLIGHEADEYYYNTVLVGDLQDRFEPHPAPWWTSTQMPQDAQLVVRYLRDGQPLKPFEKAEIVGAFIDSIGPKDPTPMPLIYFCRYVNKGGLQQVLTDKDLYIFTRVVSEDEVNGQSSSTFRAFIDGDFDF